MAGLYFPHDINARKDIKVIRMRMTLGAGAYECLQILYEMLAAEPSHTLPCDYEVIAYEEHLDAEILRRVVTDFDLFVVTDDGYFYSRRMTEQFEAIDNAKQKKADAGRKGAVTRWQTNSTPIANDSRPIADPKQCYSTPIANDSTAMANDSNININKINKDKLINNAADAALTRVRTREEAAAAAEQNLDTQTVAPDVQALLDAIGKRFNTIPLPAHLAALEQLISDCNRPGVVNGVDVVRDGLAKMDTAEAINERRVTLTMTQFLQPKYFTRLIGGDYDKVYKSKSKKSAYTGAGVSFEDMDY